MSISTLENVQQCKAGKVINHIYTLFSQIFKFVQQILFLKTYLGDELTPSSQTVGSLLIPLAAETSWENDMSTAPKDSTISKI